MSTPLEVLEESLKDLNEGDWGFAECSMAIAEIQKLQDEVEELELRVKDFRSVASFFVGANEYTSPSIAQVINRARNAWHEGESVPIEWLTVMSCLRHWHDNEPTPKHWHDKQTDN